MLLHSVKHTGIAVAIGIRRRRQSQSFLSRDRRDVDDSAVVPLQHVRESGLSFTHPRDSSHDGKANLRSRSGMILTSSEEVCVYYHLLCPDCEGKRSPEQPKSPGGRRHRFYLRTSFLSIVCATPFTRRYSGFYSSPRLRLGFGAFLLESEETIRGIRQPLSTSRTRMRKTAQVNERIMFIKSFAMLFEQVIFLDYEC